MNNSKVIYHIDDDSKLIIGHAGTGRLTKIKELVDREINNYSKIIIVDDDCLPIEVKNSKISKWKGNVELIKCVQNIDFSKRSNILFVVTHIRDITDFYRTRDIIKSKDGSMELYGCFQLPAPR